jgi:hypothetical protein
MKKITIYLLILVLSFTSFSSQAKESIKSVSKTGLVSKTVIKTNEDALIFRLNEIKNMDKSMLTNYERKNLRKEVRVINKELARSSGGIYLSVGAVLLIILLLIILL